MSKREDRRTCDGLRIMLFAAAWVLLGWPVVSLAEDESGLLMFAHLFAVGGLVVAALYAFARGGGDDGPEDRP